MAGRRRGRTGRGWDAAPPRTRPEPFTEGATDSDPSTGSGLGGSGRGGSGWSGSGWSGSGSGRRHGPGLPHADRAQADKPPPDPAERAREICLRLLSFRPRTRAELATALRGRHIPEQVIAEVLDRYGEVGMVDDQAFARAWVTSRHHGKGLARRALADELRRKGVDAESVGTALDEGQGRHGRTRRRPRRGGPGPGPGRPRRPRLLTLSFPRRLVDLGLWVAV
jgi:regulatory protein